MSEILDIKVSIVIPTHKPLISSLQQTLEALKNQDGIDEFRYEIVIVENPEKTTEVKQLVERLNVTNINHISSRLGSNNARNVGIDLARHDYIALMDDDCVPSPTWLSSLVHAHFFFPNAGIIGGPLDLSFQCNKPLWIVNDFLTLLSELHWESNNKKANAPFDIIDIPARYMVSANLSFTKSRYDQAGRLNTEIGLHGKDVYISNDEIQFVERAAKYGEPKMLWVPQLKMDHLIPEERCTIEFFEKKSRGQGYGDGIMWREENPELSISDLYYQFLQQKTVELIDYNSIESARLTISNEYMTRIFIQNLIKTKMAYVQGAINAIENKDINE